MVRGSSYVNSCPRPLNSLPSNFSPDQSSTHHTSIAQRSQMDQIKHSLRPNSLPDLINSSRRSITNTPLPNPSKRLLQLLQRRRPDNNRIPELRFQSTVILHPPIREISFRRTLALCYCGPLVEGFEEAGLVEARVVGVAVLGAGGEAAFACGDVGGGFGEEAAGEGGVGVETLGDGLDIVYVRLGR